MMEDEFKRQKLRDVLDGVKNESDVKELIANHIESLENLDKVLKTRKRKFLVDKSDPFDV